MNVSQRVRSGHEMKAASGAISTVDTTILLSAPKYHPEAMPHG